MCVQRREAVTRGASAFRSEGDGMGGGGRHIGTAERRARLAVRHRLAAGARAVTPEEVAGSLVALHGTDPATVYLAVGARLADADKTVADVERALYEDRT